MTRHSSRAGWWIGFAAEVAAIVAIGLGAFLLGTMVKKPSDVDTTPCRTDVATMIQDDGPKTWPASCAGLSKGQLDEVSAAMVADLLNDKEGS